MPVIKYNDINLTDISGEGIKDIKKARVVTDTDGFDDHCLRVFRLGAGGYTPHHKHDWEHVIHVIKGSGTVEIDGEITELNEKDFALVPSNIMHQFRNTSDSDFEFICIVPNKGDN